MHQRTSCKSAYVSHQIQLAIMTDGGVVKEAMTYLEVEVSWNTEDILDAGLLQALDDVGGEFDSHVVDCVELWWWESVRIPSVYILSAIGECRQGSSGTV